MNSQNSKNNAIKAAYGELYDSKTTNKDGWQKYPYHEPVYDKDKFESKQEGPYLCIRPKSLQGLENNRGWTRIESEEDLPKEIGDYWVVWNGKIIVQHWLHNNPDNPYNDMIQNNQVFSWMQAVTHYQPIEVPKPPIF